MTDRGQEVATGLLVRLSLRFGGRQALRHPIDGSRSSSQLVGSVDAGASSEVAVGHPCRRAADLAEPSRQLACQR